MKLHQKKMPHSKFSITARGEVYVQIKHTSTRYNNITYSAWKPVFCLFSAYRNLLQGSDICSFPPSLIMRKVSGEGKEKVQPLHEIPIPVYILQ